MPSEVVTEMILVILVVVLGTAILGFSFAFLIPQIAFANAQNQASNLASSSSVSVGPLLISGNEGSLVVELYNPIYNGTVYVYAFVAPSYEEPSAGVITPSSSSSFSTYFSNGTLAPSIKLNQIFDTNGKLLYSSPITVYKVLFNTPVTIVINNVNNNDIVIIWFIVNEGGYYFRIAYTYTGVPTQ